MYKILLLVLFFLTGSVCHAQDITIRYDGATVKVKQKAKDSVNVNIDGTKASIESLYNSRQLTLRLTGKSDDGLLNLKSAGKVKITLDALMLTTQEGAPICLKNQKKVEIAVVKGTENTLAITF